LKVRNSSFGDGFEEVGVAKVVKTYAGCDAFLHRRDEQQTKFRENSLALGDNTAGTNLQTPP
jgi:hypothetical protein